MNHMQEINFDGLIGPSHNYAGLSLGNVASAKNKGGMSKPKTAALQGLAKMRKLMSLGLGQGVFPPHPRPNLAMLNKLGFSGTLEAMASACWKADPLLFANLFSASAMWTANAATISPSADTQDGKLHISPANLVSNLHRSTEADFTYRILQTVFADKTHFTIHPPLPMQTQFGDEGAANHGRLFVNHAASGTEVFVYADKRDGLFPARQTRRASEAIARRHRLLPGRAVFLQQSNRAIEAGAFHNDVVSVTNGNVLFTHESAFEERVSAYAALQSAVPDIQIIEVPEAEVPLTDAITSYLFNSQLVTLPDGKMALVLPSEVQETKTTSLFLEKLLKQSTAIQSLYIINVRESMRNGGGPACLRLRVMVTEQEKSALDDRFLLDEKKITALEKIVTETYPETISSDDLGNMLLLQQVTEATNAVYECLSLSHILRDMQGT
jgi:succinylarginine dihydrolase